MDNKENTDQKENVLKLDSEGLSEEEIKQINEELKQELSAELKQKQLAEYKAKLKAEMLKELEKTSKPINEGEIKVEKEDKTNWLDKLLKKEKNNG